jgi:hypothetical protein
MRRLFYGCAVVGRWLSNGGGGGFVGTVIVLVAQPLRIRPFLETVCRAVWQGDIHCYDLSVDLEVGRDGSGFRPLALKALDDPEYVDPSLRLGDLRCACRATGVVPRHSGGTGSMHLYHVGRQWLSGHIFYGRSQPSGRLWLVPLRPYLGCHTIQPNARMIA